MANYTASDRLVGLKVAIANDAGKPVAVMIRHGP